MPCNLRFILPPGCDRQFPQYARTVVDSVTHVLALGKKWHSKKGIELIRFNLITHNCSGG